MPTDKISRQVHFKKYISENPWVKHYMAAESRCTGKKQPYYKRGIKNNMKTADFKFLWFRDKAWLLKNPSIDRISGGDYILNNCRFIELRENKSLGTKNYWSRKIKQLSLDGKLIKIWESCNEAARKLKLSQGCISQCANGLVYKKVGGFRWAYCNPERIKNG